MEKSPLCDDIKERVFNTAEFLLARLHLESLASAAGLSVKHVRNKPKTLPTTLKGTYDDAVERMENQKPDHRRIALKTMAWVCYAFRALSLKELQHALAVEPGGKIWSEGLVMDGQSITSLCAGRVVIVDQRTNMVHLVQYSTKSYSDDIRLIQFPEFHAKITLARLTAGDESPGRAQNRLYFLFAAYDNSVSESMRLAVIEEPQVATVDADIGAAALFLAVEHGYVQMVGNLFEVGIDVNCKDDLGQTALHRATRRKDTQMRLYTGWYLIVGRRLMDVDYVKLLFDAGAEPHPVSDQRVTPLGLAIQAEQSIVVEELHKFGPKLYQDFENVAEQYKQSAKR
ncbi:MAG: hypothetical protein Q9216_003377 [Gyalolechia sp. 2 TL-2023]